jgi:hypothetical protein
MRRAFSSKAPFHRGIEQLAYALGVNGKQETNFAGQIGGGTQTFLLSQGKKHSHEKENTQDSGEVGHPEYPPAVANSIVFQYGPIVKKTVKPAEP